MAQTGKLIIPLLASAVTASILGNILSTQFVISGLDKVGAQISFADRISMTLSDIVGFGPMYGIFILIGFTVAFLTSWLVYKFVKTGRTLVYAVAGFTAMLVMLYLMKNVFFGVQLVAGARTTVGLVLQGLVGGLAGYVFAKLSTPKISGNT